MLFILLHYYIIHIQVEAQRHTTASFAKQASGASSLGKETGSRKHTFLASGSSRLRPFRQAGGVFRRRRWMTKMCFLLPVSLPATQGRCAFAVEHGPVRLLLPVARRRVLPVMRTMYMLELKAGQPAAIAYSTMLTVWRHAVCLFSISCRGSEHRAVCTCAV